MIADGSGLITFVDRNVRAGASYDYRLGVPDGGVEQFFGQVRVVVPVKSVLALAGARPNPTSGPILVSFSLGSSSPAALEMFDVAGRRVFAREVGALGAGEHVVRLDEGGTRVPAGLYFLRLAQDGRALVARAVVGR